MAKAPSAEQPTNVEEVVVPIVDASAESSSVQNAEVTTPVTAEVTPVVADAKKPSLLETVKADIEKKGTEAPSAKEPVKETPDKPAVAADAKDPDSEGEPFHKHPRWIAMRAEVATYKEGAENWNRFNELIDKSGFENRDAATGWLDRGAELTRVGVTSGERELLVEFGHTAKTNPARAMEILKPIYENLREFLGETLSPDLQKAVDDGEMTEDAARRLSKSEASARISSQRVQRTEQDSRTQREAGDAERDQAESATAVVAWERQHAKTDPDWKRIAPAVVEAVTNLRDARKPRTAKESLAVCNDALAFVKRTVGIGAPHRPAVTPPNTNSSTHPTKPRPKSAFEAAKQGLGG